MSETARRIRILEEIRKIGMLKKDDLALKYPWEDMISVRLKRLVALGCLRKASDKYVAGNSVYFWMAKAVAVLKNFLFPVK